jgi:5'-nucleotidase
MAVVDFLRSPDGTRGIAVAIQDLWAGAGENPGLAAMIATNQESADRIVERHIATLRTDISRSDAPEYPLGRLIADAFRNAARTHAAIVPNTHIRDDLPGGELTYGDLFSVLGTNEPILILEIPGSLLEETLEWVLFDAIPSAHVSGLVVRYDPDRTPGQRIRDLRFPDGVEIRDDELYTLAVPASIHAGEDQFPMLFRVEARESGTTELEALASYLQRLPSPVRAPRSQRFTTD